MKKTLLLTSILTGLTFSAISQNSNCEDSLNILQKKINYLEQRSPEYKATYLAKTSTYELQFLDASFESSGKYKVNLLLKNTGDDKVIIIIPEDIDLIDEKGNGYNCTDIKLGNSEIKYSSSWGKCATNTIYTNVPTKLSLTFDSANDIDFIAICVIKLVMEKQAYNAPKLTLKLNNIQTKK